MKIVKITRKDIQLFETLGRNGFIDTPANMEFHDGSPATDKDFRFIITLRAALATLQSMGIVEEIVVLELRTPYQE